MNSKKWQFWIDIGGTFTDLILCDHAGNIDCHKTLSSGKIKGQVSEILAADLIQDLLRIGDPESFYNGFQFSLIDATGEVCFRSSVVESSGKSGTLQLASAIPKQWHRVTGLNYELDSDEQAPVIGIRYLLGLKRIDPIPAVDIRLGTTRGTNALLERKGARCALITTAGFADCLRLGNQDRPRLFDLDIQKPEMLFESVVEIDERITACGEVVRSPDEVVVRSQFQNLKQTGIDSIALCLLHASAHPDHELLLEQWASQVGFAEISVSHRLSSSAKLISRGDTTLVNAYLNPVLEDYIASIKKSLPDSDLKLMTSSGGLVAAEHFQGKESILSGPAGGVVGFSKVGQKLGYPRSIGFDMGGTSTDVSRFDGHFEREYETVKAGIRLATPMLAIETVAAGGGSVCRFDGVRLHVGPESAGADPGPCCYGKAGPLTVTDMNLYTGRLLANRFPIPLDVDAVDKKLVELCQEIAASATPQQFTPQQLAEGFLEIANTRMARAIRKISVARGYDPADYLLVCFGGAGGQHACALARELGMSKIVLHPLAGVLSAYGMGQADIVHHAAKSLLKPWEEFSNRDLRKLFDQLEQQARQKVWADGISQEKTLSAKMSLDLRYQGQETALNILLPQDSDFQQAFHLEHQRRYGFHRPQQSLEIVTARVEVTGTASTQSHSDRYKQVGSSSPSNPEATIKVFLQGAERTAELFSREILNPGQVINGPAIIYEATSTTLIESDFTAHVLPAGELELIRIDDNKEARSRGVPEVSATKKADPVLLEIFHNHFASIAEQMGETLRQTAHSVNVKERLDYSCAMFDPQGRLVANAPHIPVHLGAMGETVKRTLADNPALSPGDTFIANDPYQGGSHLPDVTVISPLVDPETKQVLFVVASRAHHAEIGGITPGSMPPFSKNLAEEGVVLRNFPLIKNGIDHFDSLRNLLSSGPCPSRNVDDNLADLHAQLAANKMGIDLLSKLIESRSLSIVQDYMQYIRQAAAAKTKLALSRLKQGVHQMTDYLDDGSPISVAINIEKEKATVDFTGTGPVLNTNLNANRAIVTAAVLYVFRCLIAEDIPLNEGVLEPIDIILPECLLNPPAFDDPAKCAAMVGGNVETSQRVVDVLLGTLQLAAASQGSMNNLTFGDETFGYYETICGGSGATRNHPGADAVHTHMTNTRLSDVEVIERQYPVRIRSFRIRKDSGGKGKRAGGNGIVREIEFLKPLKVSMLSQRRGKYQPFGLQGGGAGQIGQNLLRRNNSEVDIDLGGSFQIEVSPGDLLTIKTPGGGAWGSED